MMSPMSRTPALRTSEKADGMIGRDSDCGSIFPWLDDPLWVGHVEGAW